MTSENPDQTPTPRTAAEIFRDLGLQPPNPAAPDTEPAPYGTRMTAEETADWNRERAAAYFRANTPAMFRHAWADDPAVLDWTTRYLLDPAVAGSLAILGATGRGKTYQAFGALARVAASGAPPVAWVAETAPDLYARLRPSSGLDTEAEFARVAGAPLLLLDDLGAAKGTEWTEEVTFRLINRRYAHCLPTVITSNLPPEQLRPILGDRVSSRLRQMCTIVRLRGDDRREAA